MSYPCTVGMFALGHPKAVKGAAFVLLCGVVAAAAVLLGVVRPVLALLAAGVILRAGVTMLRALARPVPPPPESGLLRKVSIRYRCSICGAEVKMTIAPDEDPDPPRHCQDDMALMAPIE